MEKLKQNEHTTSPNPSLQEGKPFEEGKEIPDAKKDRTPEVKPRNLQELIAQISGDAKCNRSNCHGKGYIGIQKDPKTGWETVLLCSCGKVEKTDYVNTIERIADVHTLLFALLKDEVQGSEVNVLKRVVDLEEVLSKKIDDVRLKIEAMQVENWIMYSEKRLSGAMEMKFITLKSEIQRKTFFGGLQFSAWKIKRFFSRKTK